MNNYQVADVFEFGDAGELIQTPKPMFLDEIAGSEGPLAKDIEEE